MRRVDLRGVAAEQLPMALAELHWATEVDERVAIRWTPGRRGADLLTGAGFAPVSPGAPRGAVVRVRTLPDVVGPAMRLLLCGLNPSVYSADRGVGFARPGNRFWPAMLAAGLADTPRDSRALLVDHGIGTTDLVKRATAQASSLSADEYRDGVARVGRLCAWLRPGAVAMVGLTGWRTAVDGRAVTGWQDARLGGRPVYVMPNPSGLNAHTQHDGFVSHLRAIVAGPPIAF